ncbi:MAG: potassium uptake protein, TrkH family [Oscillospiraceae bacterium]|nr:potassium uptake protein, TrkH family [Oscillospiraceae bacterium]
MLLRRLRQRIGQLSAMQIIVLVFLAIILAGALLLTLPIAAKNGQSTPFLTALFTATSCTCVTGLSLVDTFTHWTSFGQVVMLLLIQIGGLGFMTVMTLFFLVARRRLGLKERLIIAQSFALDNLSGIADTVKKVLCRTLVLEAVGAVILTIRFLFQMPVGRAVWCGVFHAVSAFCNAGFDIFGAVEQGGSLMPYVADPVVNITLMLLIVLGGLGFFVWDDILTAKRLKDLRAYSKLILIISGVLIFGGAALYCVFEWNNPATLGAMSIGEKILAALFQSVTVRTAGFYTVSQVALTDASVALTDVLMFIGGGSGSTAGGAKMATVAVLLLSVLATARGRSRVTVFRRTVSESRIKDAMTLVVMMFVLCLTTGVFLSCVNALPLRDCFYETISALATVGLTTGITPQLSGISHVILIVLMFFGRVGIMTISLGFLFSDRAQERYRYADTNILIG